LSARAFLAQRSFSLDSVKFLNAACGVRLDWALPWFHRIALLAFITTSLFPAALWAGAITPVISSKISTKQILLPAFTNITLLDVGITGTLSNVKQSINTAKGIFTYLPEADIQGLLLNSAQDASSRTGGTNSHAKLDKTGYVYTGRSYGAGASVGLVDGFTQPVTSYTYNETGFRTETQCIYNATSAFVLEELDTPDTWTIEVFDATGSLPNGGTVMFAAAGLDSADVVAVAAGLGGLDRPHYVAFATGNGTWGKYGELSNVQCQVTFDPMEFAISVNVTGLTITVNPLEAAPLPPHASDLAAHAIYTLNNLGSTLATTIWTSVLGDVFITNIANVVAASGTGNSSNLRGVADAVSSIIDNAFGAYSAAQLMIQNDTTPTIVEAESVAVVFGSPVYVYSVLVVNLVICLIYFIEVVRTRGWKRLSNFNFMDIKSVIISASIGGSAIANKVQSLHCAHASPWEAAEDDHLIGQIRICLSKVSRDRVAVTIADHGVVTMSGADLARDRQATDSVALLRKPVPGMHNSETASMLSES
jgi:hypothetical protein